MGEKSKDGHVKENEELDCVMVISPAEISEIGVMRSTVIGPRYMVETAWALIRNKKTEKLKNEKGIK